MKIKTTALLVLLCISMISMAQEIDGYRFCGSREYTYNSNKERVEKRTFDAAYNLQSYVKYVYDSSGNKTETLKFDSTGVLLKRYAYVFDEQGFKVANTTCHLNNNNKERKTYVNNNLGQNIRTDYFDDKGLTKYVEITYAEKGEVQSRKTFDTERKLISDIHYKYNYERDRLVEKSTFSGNDKLISKTIYEYNTDGYKSSHSSNYVSNKRSSKKRLYKYNSNGLCERSLVYELIK